METKLQRQCQQQEKQSAMCKQQEKQSPICKQHKGLFTTSQVTGQTKGEYAPVQKG